MAALGRIRPGRAELPVQPCPPCLQERPFKAPVQIVAKWGSKDDKDLTQIYNRLAKEGQKLRIGLCYATQEVSSISSSILKNTQNWFVSHLNNRDELRELDKYYDFEDFTDSLRRTIDKGFIRLKIDSNTFIVPIQVDPFKVTRS